MTSTRSIPWPRILAEGFAIVVSILLAFGIQAWWEGRQERAEERAILLGLEEDFMANLEELEFTVQMELGHHESLGRLATISEDEIRDFAPESVAPFMRALSVSSLYEARDGTLDGVISSGRLGLIQDTRIREGLTSWKRLLEDTAEERTALLEVDQKVQARGAELGGPWRSFGNGPFDQTPRLLEAWARQEAGEASDLVTIVNDESLMAMVRDKRFSIMVYLFALEQLRAEGDRVLALIQSTTR